MIFSYGQLHCNGSTHFKICFNHVNPGFSVEIVEICLIIRLLQFKSPLENIEMLLIECFRIVTSAIAEVWFIQVYTSVR